ncbi:MAG: hypothetical protein Q8P80_04785 [Candidatus Levybacteria bacterium]|nr:hypothetical protein [Candidatus Levybacteria bacterium]
MNIPKEITKLFLTRDKAVGKNDKELFLSTQVGEIEYSSVEGYFSIDVLKTEVLYIYSESDLEKVVFVKENYFPKKKVSRISFIIYFLANTVGGWKIYKLRY